MPNLYLLPCGNPDGRHHVMTVDDMWRKNLRDNPNTTCDGVDLNRNCDILWGVTQGQTSCNPCSDVYAGPSAFSEPESRNVRHLLDTYRIDCFADVHSYSELVLYPWDHAPTQTNDPTKVFTTLPSGTCQPIADLGYKEYLHPRDLLRFQTVAKRIVDAIAAVRGRVYTPQASIALYPTTGTHSDYAFSRHIASSSLRKVYGFTLETGPWVGNAPDSFHPADPEPIKREAESGLLALVQQCICAIELIGLRLLGREDEVDALRGVRDELLALANYPPADPTDLDDASEEALANHATGFTYEPGSTFKAFTVAAALEDAGVKLATVASDILGVSGRAMLAALAQGTTDPAVLAGTSLLTVITFGTRLNAAIGAISRITLNFRLA